MFDFEIKDIVKEKLTSEEIAHLNMNLDCRILSASLARIAVFVTMGFNLALMCYLVTERDILFIGLLGLNFGLLNGFRRMLSVDIVDAINYRSYINGKADL